MDVQASYLLDPGVRVFCRLMTGGVAITRWGGGCIPLSCFWLVVGEVIFSEAGIQAVYSFLRFINQSLALSALFLTNTCFSVFVNLV